MLCSIKPSMFAQRRAAFALVALFFFLFMSVDSVLSEEEEADEVGFLQKPVLTPQSSEAKTWPMLIPLQRESVPVMQKGKIVAHKSTYSGAVSVGRPAQEFRVVFDTGSGHVLVPSSDCADESCAVHRRFDLAASTTATAVNADGSVVPPDEYGDQVTVGFGTGKVKGEFVRDQVCLNGGDPDLEVCVEVTVLTAVEMSTKPFKAMGFDGIFGLGLSALAVKPEFNYLHRFAGSGLGAASQFAFYMSSNGVQGNEGGEIAFGGYNSERLLTPLKWAPVAKKQMGHWQIEIKEVRIGNRTLDLCKDGSCRGIVDTGTSHFGVPGAGLKDFQSSLTAPGYENQDCRDAEAPTIELVLEGFTITMGPENYMRPLPLDQAFSGNEAGSTALTPQSAQSCSPKLIPVNYPEPLGPKLFLLGEPVLHRYYTVYDWESTSIGFGLAATDRNRAQLARQGILPTAGQEQQSESQEEEIFSFMQVTVTVSVRARRGSRSARAAGNLALLPP